MASEDQISRVLACLTGITGWGILDSSKHVAFQDGEVDLDAKVSHVDRSTDDNIHKGRLFSQKERASDKLKVSTMPDRAVGKDVAGTPEANLKIGKPILGGLC